MSDLERILKLASHGTANARSQAPAERELKDVPVVEEPTTTREAVGEFAEPIYDLIDMHFEGDCQPVFDDLVRFLSGDQIKEFVDDFRRHHDLNDMDEAYNKKLNASEYKCKDCGDTMHKPTTDCSHDVHDEKGDWWVDKDGNGVPDSLEEAPNEGNEFSGELAKAKASGKKEFEVDGKKYKVESEEAVTEGDVPEYACINIDTGAFGYCDKDELHKFTHIVPASEFTYFDPTSGVNFADFDDEMAAQEGWTKIGNPTNEAELEGEFKSPEGGPLSYKKVGDYTYVVKDENGKEHKAEVGAMGDEQDNYSPEEIEQTMDQEGLQMLIRQAKMGAPAEAVEEAPMDDEMPEELTYMKKLAGL